MKGKIIFCLMTRQLSWFHLPLWALYRKSPPFHIRLKQLHCYAFKRCFCKPQGCHDCPILLVVPVKIPHSYCNQALSIVAPALSLFFLAFCLGVIIRAFFPPTIRIFLFFCTHSLVSECRPVSKTKNINLYVQCDYMTFWPSEIDNEPPHRSASQRGISGSS